MARRHPVGIKGRYIKNRVLGSREGSNLLFELLMNILGTADKPYTCSSRNRGSRSPGGRPQSHAGAKVPGSCWRRNSARSCPNPDFGALGTGNDAFGLVETGHFDFFNLFCNALYKISFMAGICPANISPSALPVFSLFRLRRLQSTPFSAVDRSFPAVCQVLFPEKREYYFAVTFSP